MMMAMQNNNTTLEDEELLGLYEVMEALLEDSDWAQAHPQPCTETPWPGVECEITSEDPPIYHITKIHIGPDILFPPCKSSAYLSQSLLKLHYLKTLSIFSCFVSSPVTLPKTIFNSSSSLEHLALQSNPTLHGGLPPSLGDIATLRVLTLSQNNLQGPIPREIGGLVSLQQLDLSYNNLSGQIPREIGDLRSLTILDLSGNNGIQGDIPESLGQLQLLNKMDLSSNKLTGRIPPSLGRVKRLVLLDLSQNSLSGPIPESLSSLELLEYLVIDENPIRAELPLFIGNLRNLKSVSISGCGLIGPIPNSLSSLDNLRALSLDNNSLSGPVPPNLGSLPNLDQLNLSHNNLSGVLQLSCDFIGRLGTRLDVRGNNGLCISYDDDQTNKKKNLSSHLEIPACFNIRHSRSGKPLADDAGIKPSWYNTNNISSSTSSSCLVLKAIQFTLVFNFVLGFLNFLL
ncbi:receptor like protein 29-like [Senna tora]|uniref:Receptor like protein 29-like n=1 Tax=Senna tora TaxID=362788 RepID=A0A834VZD4_9FABA|nr:receptor like protein 29-like [Senna tora]